MRVPVTPGPVAPEPAPIVRIPVTTKQTPRKPESEPAGAFQGSDNKRYNFGHSSIPRSVVIGKSMKVKY
ncbi:hypothetical protein FSOLCH5_010299 [Fusarium solani]|nr:hypothetical protein NW759_002230 [Fusarium solani]